ncbi:MAG: formate dehydrogenase [Proteobacteria bacterium]|nr:formate dehydrogenase [Pseudomonadota bacterium]
MSDQSDSDTPRVEPGVTPPDVRRRRFLLAFGAGAAGAAVAAPAVAGPAAVVTPPSAAPASPGYRETDHIRAYYATARR